ncbi:hypothetical protein [Taklimakanibacter lacteus]|uniref:hypothetical protein n=1 Tax=Taklimakanibacter lacteus TaxID=2268456 RepID=UPI0034D79D63
MQVFRKGVWLRPLYSQKDSLIFRELRFIQETKLQKHRIDGLPGGADGPPHAADRGRIENATIAQEGQKAIGYARFLPLLHRISALPP